MQLTHVYMAYLYKGAYCGDFELDPDTFYMSLQKKDFTDVIAVHPPNTHFHLPFHDCNPLLPPGSSVKLPLCDNILIVGTPPPLTEDDSECIREP